MNILEPITQKILAHMRENQSSFTLACRQSSKTEAIIRFAVEKVKEEDSIAKLIVIVVPKHEAINDLQRKILDKYPCDTIRGFGCLEFRNKTNVSILRIVAGNDPTIRGMRPTLVIYDEAAFNENTLRTIAYVNCPFSHYVTSYNPKDKSFFDFVKSYPTLVINWREVHGHDPQWVINMAEHLSSSDFFNEYENGRSQ